MVFFYIYLPIILSIIIQDIFFIENNSFLFTQTSFYNPVLILLINTK